MESVHFTSTMSPFFSLAASTKRERIAMLKKAFLFVASDDLNNFIKYFLNMTGFGNPKFLPNIQNEKAFEIIENLKILMKNSPQKHLPALRSLVISSYSLSELNNLGFNMTKSEFENSKKSKKITLNKKTNKNENYSLKKEIIKKILAYVLKYCFEKSQASNKKIGNYTNI